MDIETIRANHQADKGNLRHMDAHANRMYAEIEHLLALLATKGSETIAESGDNG